jgi:CRP-like cAMP-binding protein
LPISDRKPIGLTTYDAKDPETKFPPTKAARQPTRENAMTSIRERNEPAASARQTAETLRLLQQHVPQQRRVVHAGDRLYQAGERFTSLHVLNSGFFKVVNISSDGRERVVALYFLGDWLGFDGIALGRHGCDAVAIDTGEIWTFRYSDLLEACARELKLMSLLHAAMSREIGRDRGISASSDLRGAFSIEDLDGDEGQQAQVKDAVQRTPREAGIDRHIRLAGAIHLLYGWMKNQLDLLPFGVVREQSFLLATLVE